LPRCACADLRFASPFPLRLAPLQGWGYPSACTCYPPPSPGGVRHLVEMPPTNTKRGATTMTSKKHTAGFQTLALSTIHESTTNPRRTFDESKLAELAESLRTQGLIHPITVRPNSNAY